MAMRISLHEAVATVPTACGRVVPASVAYTVAEAEALPDVAVGIIVNGWESLDRPVEQQRDRHPAYMYQDWNFVDLHQNHLLFINNM